MLMRVGITGAGGLIGSAVTHGCEKRGWIAVPLPRQPLAEQLETLDAIVHLAGEPVAGPWSDAKKSEIRRSRVDGTRALVAALTACRTRPRVLASSSAVGYYGDRGDEPLFESSHPGIGFLAEVCQEWEAAALRAQALGIRTVLLRTGVVLARDGGALPKMGGPFAFGAGGPLGNGRQFVPWIALDDIAGLYLFAIEHDAMQGAVNAVSPDVATNARLAQAIGSALHRPALAPAPGFVLRAMLGEFAQTLLGSQLVLPSVASRAGYAWREPRLENALRRILASRSDASPILQRKTFEQFVPAPLDDVFRFFCDPHNLETITPPSLGFAITQAPDTLGEGSVIEYDLRLHGLPLHWKTLITQWNPPHRFADVQLRGPYALWEHEHRFTSAAGGTTVTDDVTYALPFAPLSSVAQPLVRRDVDAIFAFRRHAIAQNFVQ